MYITLPLVGENNNKYLLPLFDFIPWRCAALDIRRALQILYVWSGVCQRPHIRCLLLLRSNVRQQRRLNQESLRHRFLISLGVRPIRIHREERNHCTTLLMYSVLKYGVYFLLNLIRYLDQTDESLFI